MGNGIATVGGILLIVLGFVMHDELIVLSGSVLISAALIADAILDRRDSDKK
jgi:hypothetical protein